MRAPRRSSKLVEYLEPGLSAPTSNLCVVSTLSMQQKRVRQSFAVCRFMSMLVPALPRARQRAR